MAATSAAAATATFCAVVRLCRRPHNPTQNRAEAPVVNTVCSRQGNSIFCKSGRASQTASVTGHINTADTAQQVIQYNRSFRAASEIPRLITSVKQARAIDSNSSHDRYNGNRAALRARPGEQQFIDKEKVIPIEPLRVSGLEICRDMPLLLKRGEQVDPGNRDPQNHCRDEPKHCPDPLVASCHCGCIQCRHQAKHQRHERVRRNQQRIRQRQAGLGMPSS